MKPIGARENSRAPLSIFDPDNRDVRANCEALAFYFSFLLLIEPYFNNAVK
jgi:hypothetical protein